MSDFLILDTKSEEQKSSVTQGFSMDSFDAWLISKQKIKLEHKVIFFRLLATMVNAGLSIMKAVGILEKQEKNVLLKRAYGNIITGIKSGKNLSQTLREYGENFSDSECSIIESGEKTGKLNFSLIQLADQVEKVSSISKKLKGALMYPAAIVVVMIGSIMVLMTMVVPKIVEIFGDKDKLPPLTRMLIATSDFFVGYWWAVILLFLGLFVAISFWKQTESGHYRFDKIMLHLPIIGKVMQKVILSKFSRVLSNLLSSGISIVESLRIVSDVVGNEVYRQRILLLREDIKKGIKIGESLEDDRLFPEMLVQMIKVGEETAKLDTIILKIADFYDEEVDTTINSINKLLEPIIIVSMAVVVGFIAVGIMQPIMNLADVVSEK
ncbi:MAG: type II secretion system F family protein [Candidatus Gracilibacteria bacterium]|nr:type II secretion system F family protein [Candidatus Gracilibacteria bacterium]